jgi:ketosteroid isomerase-like protein
MHKNEQLIEKFYKAFQNRDAKTMNECYHDDIEFSDMAFTNLKGKQAKAMWLMLCERGKDLELTFSDISANDKTGKAHWEAKYTFSQTGKKVYNIIDATFEFRDGKIIKHQDTFDFWRWSSMALGLPGSLLGWFPPFQSAVRKKAMEGLEIFMKKNSI